MIIYDIFLYANYYLHDIGCSNSSDMDNGDITLHDSSNTSYGATADVKCNTGYISSVDIVTCTINETWSFASCSVVGMYSKWHKVFATS